MYFDIIIFANFSCDMKKKILRNNRILIIEIEYSL